MYLCYSVQNDIIGSMYSMGNDVCVCMGMKNSVVLLVPLNMSTQHLPESRVFEVICKHKFSGIIIVSL